MCIAIAVPPGIALSKWELENCWDSNDDGAGLMYAEDGRIVIQKEFYSFDKWHKMYDEALERARAVNSGMALHFRIGTSGELSEYNIHPFLINENVALCHNGVLDIPAKNRESDTQEYVNNVLKKLPENFYQYPVMLSLIGEHISGSKFVLLDNEGLLYIINEELGEFDSRGVWYSNSSYLYSGRSRSCNWSKYDYDEYQVRKYFQGYNDWEGSEEYSHFLNGDGPFKHAPSGKGSLILHRGAKVSTTFFCRRCSERVEVSADDLFTIDMMVQEFNLCPECAAQLAEPMDVNCTFCGAPLDLEANEVPKGTNVYCTRCSDRLEKEALL